MVIDYNATVLLGRIEQIEKLLRSHDAPGQLHHAGMLALGIARNAPNGALASLALRVVTAASTLEQFPHAPQYLGALDVALRQLRVAVDGGDPKLPGQSITH